MYLIEREIEETLFSMFIACVVVSNVSESLGLLNKIGNCWNCGVNESERIFFKSRKGSRLKSQRINFKSRSCFVTQETKPCVCLRVYTYFCCNS
jgi:hypothetical protein